MTKPGYTQISFAITDVERLEEIMRSEGLKTKTEAFRMLMRDWERSRKLEIVPTISAVARNSAQLRIRPNSKANKADECSKRVKYPVSDILQSQPSNAVLVGLCDDGCDGIVELYSVESSLEPEQDL